MRTPGLGLALALVMVGCGEETGTPAESPPPADTDADTADGPPESCSNCALLVAGTCEPVGPAECPAGWGSDGRCGCDPGFAECADGEVARPGGDCLPAGPDCALADTSPEADGGCSLLPVCGGGLDRGGACRGKSPQTVSCEGWPEAPATANVYYVDGSRGGGNGSKAEPWTSIAQALANVPDKAVVRVEAGTYSAPLKIERPVSIVGRCPALVRLTGAAWAETLWLDIEYQTGVEVVDTTDVTLHNLTFATPQVAVAVADSAVTLRNIHVEKALGMGLFLQRADATLHDVTVTNVLGSNIGEGPCVEIATSEVTWTGGAVHGCKNEPSAHGIRARAVSTVTLRGVEVTNARHSGILAREASTLTLERVRVVQTAPDSKSLASAALNVVSSTVFADDCEIHDTHLGLNLVDATGTVRRSRIRTEKREKGMPVFLTQSQPPLPSGRSSLHLEAAITDGIGVWESDVTVASSRLTGSAEPWLVAGQEATVTITDSHFSGAELIGMSTSGGSLTIEGSVLQGGDAGGVGVLLVGRDGASVEVDESLLTGGLTAAASYGATFTGRRSVFSVSSTAASYVLGGSGSTVTLEDAVVAGSTDTGVLMELGSDLTMSRSVVRDTARSNAPWGLGLYCGEAQCTLSRSLLEATSRAAIYAIDAGTGVYVTESIVRDVAEQATSEDPRPAAEGLVVHAGTRATVTDSLFTDCKRAGILVDGSVPSESDLPTRLDLSGSRVVDTAFSVVLQGGATYHTERDNELESEPLRDGSVIVEGESLQGLDPKAIFEDDDG